MLTNIENNILILAEYDFFVDISYKHFDKTFLFKLPEVQIGNEIYLEIIKNLKQENKKLEKNKEFMQDQINELLDENRTFSDRIKETNIDLDKVTEFTNEKINCFDKIKEVNA